DDAADRAGAIERRPAALDHLDAVDHPCRDLLDPVDLRKRGNDRLAIDENLRVRATETEQPNLREVAVLTVVLHTNTRRVLDGIGQRSRARLENVLRADDF